MITLERVSYKFAASSQAFEHVPGPALTAECLLKKLVSRCKGLRVCGWANRAGLIFCAASNSLKQTNN